jgi:hypothetical protein
MGGKPLGHCHFQKGNEKAGWFSSMQKRRRVRPRLSFLLFVARQCGATASAGSGGVKRGGCGNWRLKRMGHGPSWAS